MAILAEDLLAEGETMLRSRGIESPRIESEILLAHALALSRDRIVASLREEIPEARAGEYRALIADRSRRRPLQYVTGRAEFYSLSFIVNPSVLIPRPETELLVDRAIELFSDRPCLIADVGTGSGCIAIALAKHLPKARIVATDISLDAVETASANARANGVAGAIRFLTGDLFNPLEREYGRGTIDLVISNPPYIAKRDLGALQPEVQCEPSVALDGGEDGLFFLKQILTLAPSYLQERGRLILELGIGEAAATVAFAKENGNYRQIDVSRDIGGIERRFEAVCRAG